MPAPPDTPVIVLAAGASSRMRGRDKLLEEVAGEPLIRRQARQARAVTTGAVLIALPPRPHARYAALDGLAVTPLPVPRAAEGMGRSIATAFCALPECAQVAVLLLADLPDLTEQDIRHVMGAVDLSSTMRAWRGATEEGKPGHPIIAHRDLFGDFRALTGDDGGRSVMAQWQAHTEIVPLSGQRARRDLDTPEDWAAWRRGATD